MEEMKEKLIKIYVTEQFKILLFYSLWFFLSVEFRSRTRIRSNLYL